MEVQLLGHQQLRRLAAQLKEEGNKGLGREMSAALRKVAKPVQASIKDEYEDLPKRGGYANTFTRSMKWRTGLRTGARNASFRMTLFGEGKHERRDIKALEAGRLRHPVQGRGRRIRRGPRRGSRIANPWSVTSVRGGYWERGTSKVLEQVNKEMLGVLEDFRDRLAK